MRRVTVAMVALAVLGTTAVEAQRRGTAGRVEAKLRDAKGADKGLVSAAEAAGSTIVTVAVRGLPPGAHGLHVHAVGRCDAPLFESAGAHWNPTGKQHGRDNPAGAHRGDLPNIEVGANGAGSVSFELPAKLREVVDQDGAAVIVHAKADDYRTDPSGNSGGRIACAALVGRRR